MMNFETLSRLAEAFNHNLAGYTPGVEHHAPAPPSRLVVEDICGRYLKTLVALFQYSSNDEKVQIHVSEIRTGLCEQICRAVRLRAFTRGELADTQVMKRIGESISAVFDTLPELAFLLASDVHAAFANDPATGGYEEILLAYPGLEAITLQRLAHKLYVMKLPLIPRMITEIAHSRTGIDIHPGAAIGESFFIDHGTGVVIGETATIGRAVTLYHGVTLGAFNPLAKDEHGLMRRGQDNKRHPDLEDHVTVYPNATILGGDTCIGHHSAIGGNVWLTHSVPPYSKVIVRDAGVFVQPRTRNGITTGGSSLIPAAITPQAGACAS
jgi:serine O-acetyltransferase